MLKLNALETQKWWEWRKVEEIDQFVEKPAVALSLSHSLSNMCVYIMLLADVFVEIMMSFLNYFQLLCI